MHETCARTVRGRRCVAQRVTRRRRGRTNPGADTRRPQIRRRRVTTLLQRAKSGGPAGVVAPARDVVAAVLQGARAGRIRGPRLVTPRELPEGHHTAELAGGPPARGTPARSNVSRRQQKNATVSTQRGSRVPIQEWEFPTPKGCAMAIAIAFPIAVSLAGNVTSTCPRCQRPSAAARRRDHSRSSSDRPRGHPCARESRPGPHGCRCSEHDDRHRRDALALSGHRCRIPPGHSAVSTSEAVCGPAI